MNQSKYYVSIILISKITLLFFIFTNLIGGNSMIHVSHSILFLFFYFEIVNTILFIYLLRHNRRILNISRANEQSLIDLNIKKIVLQLIIEEVKPDSLNNVDEIHIKELIHEAKRRVQEKYVTQLKEDETI